MREILLGHKRPPRSRRWGRVVLAVILLVGVGGGVAWLWFRRATSYAVPGGRLPAEPLRAEGSRLAAGASSLERVGELWVLRIAGDPYALGGLRGRLAGGHAAGGEAFDEVVTGREPGGWLAGIRHDASVRWRYRLLPHGVSADLRAEVAGLAAALHVPYTRLLRRQVAFDLGAAGGPSTGLRTGLTSGLAFAGGAERAFVGRTFAVPGAPAAETVIAFVKPTGKIAFAAVGAADDVGVVTGVNAESIAVAVDPATADGVRAASAGTPVALIARDVLERAHTLDEAVHLLETATPLGAASFLVVDGKAKAWAIVERAPGRKAVTRPSKPAAIGDLLTGGELGKDAENARARRVRPGQARVARVLGELAHTFAGEVTPLTVATLLRDRLDANGQPLPLGNGNAVDDLAARHTVIIDVTGQRLWVSDGPGAAGRFHAFDLAVELRGDPPRPEVIDLPEDQWIDLAKARRVTLARVELQAAEADLRHGRRRQAAEGAARAIALWPELADAHRVAADAARATGDEAGALAGYRRFLELSPADPGAIEEAKAALGSP